MPFSGPELTSPIFAMMAEGVRGGFMRRSDSVVVCDFRSVVDALMTSRGFAISDAEASGFEVVSLLGAREEWKCVRSACVVLVRSTSVRRSFGFDIATRLQSRTLGRSFFLAISKWLTICASFTSQRL